jgi:hypothetical protein
MHLPLDRGRSAQRSGGNQWFDSVRAMRWGSGSGRVLDLPMMDLATSVRRHTNCPQHAADLPIRIMQNLVRLAENSPGSGGDQDSRSMQPRQATRPASPLV